MTGQLLVNENWNNRAESVGTWRISTPNMAPLNQAMCAQLTGAPTLESLHAIFQARGQR